MADNEGSRRDNGGSAHRDRKRKWESGGGGGRRGGRGGRPLQHGSRPDKKRNMGRKDHK
jgi:tRNA pseudouridine38-40 synthase